MLADLRVQRPGAGEIAAKQLLDDHAAPGSGSLVGETHRAELLDGLREESRCDGEIEEDVARKLPGLLHVLDFRLQMLEGVGTVPVVLRYKSEALRGVVPRPMALPAAWRTA